MHRVRLRILFRIRSGTVGWKDSLEGVEQSENSGAEDDDVLRNLSAGIWYWLATSRDTDAWKHTHTHTHTFNGPLSGTTQVSRYKKGKTNLDFIRARDSEWQWHQLGHMQVCTSLQTDNHASTQCWVLAWLLKFFYRPDALPAAQPTVSKHWRLSTDAWK